jgi:hypothetical protein
MRLLFGAFWQRRSRFQESPTYLCWTCLRSSSKGKDLASATCKAMSHVGICTPWISGPASSSSSSHGKWDKQTTNYIVFVYEQLIDVLKGSCVFLCVVGLVLGCLFFLSKERCMLPCFHRYILSLMYRQ